MHGAGGTGAAISWGMTSSLRTIDLVALAGVTGGAQVVVNGVEYGPGTYINGVKVDSNGSGVNVDRTTGSIVITHGSNNTVVISR